MKLILKKIACIILALVLITPIIPKKINNVEAESFSKLNTSATIINKGNTLSLLVLNAGGSNITWTSENENVATVDADGVVTAVNKGSTNIIANVVYSGSTNVNQHTCKVGVKTSDYLPETPTNYSYLAGKDITAGKYVVFSDKTSSLGAFWEINNKMGNKTIENEFTQGTAIITVAQSQSLVIHRGYAIPFNVVSNSILRLCKLNEVTILY